MVYNKGLQEALQVNMSTESLSVLSPVVEDTTVGSYFVSNYPPYSFWTPEHVGDVMEALHRAPEPGTPLGVYLHIPFCRKRCHFCYFKVYTDKNAAEIEGYIDAAIHELELYAKMPFIGGGPPPLLPFRGGAAAPPNFSQTGTSRAGVEGVAPRGRGRGRAVGGRAGDAH